ncbi:CotS family spore coat protein [Clostridium gasigenes]|uniref:CotS family spore coat protein n=1 Tax=Clostridium gasigenes TaxID=94869 RepID=A0A1H0VT53_9CLOT|nr:CotS family spore coat protein [Clostridium gasigenes]MBB6622533.1 CotS family spore coat protein [Clostridium gasigenes]MBB6714180.1 CotS family spore coat protein [Clostridium gasigenes]MBU3088513.1 CotS family spore coat protein [Clostridium gasigenes]MBU3108160.1 CotS family spore coat protein [Clostridium gasigenes]MBU3132768.1 CotS family spore coat protein [Clostridium gasigenes]
MNKLRYIDKKILCKYDLSEEFFENLGVEINDIVPLRKVFVLVTSEGKKILKIVNSTEERLEFIDKSLDYISKRYSNVLSYYKNKNNKVYEIWKGETYVLLDMIDGREATFSNPIEINLCSKAIANMHLASKGILDTMDEDIVIENSGENLIRVMNDSYKILENIKYNVNKYRYKNEFDKMFIINVDYNLKEIEKSLEFLALSDYNNILLNKSKMVLCHNDLAHHNFIIDGEEVKIIDFDYCKFDTRVVDVANYTLKVIKNFAYDSKKVKAILDSYNEVEKLDNEEIRLLYVILSFPKDFVTIVTDYYYKQKSWDEDVFINRFKSKLENETHRKEFLNNFIQEFKEYFY